MEGGGGGEGRGGRPHRACAVLVIAFVIVIITAILQRRVSFAVPMVGAVAVPVALVAVLSACVLCPHFSAAVLLFTI